MGENRPLIEESGNVSAHIHYDEDFMLVHCCDGRHEDLTVEVIVNLLTLLVDGYGEPSTELPTPEFLIEAVQYSLDNQQKLREAGNAFGETGHDSSLLPSGGTQKMMQKETLTSAELVAAHRETAAALAARARGPRAQSVSVKDGNLILTLSGGAVEGTVLCVPVANLPLVRDISEEDLSEVRLMGGGSAILWPKANVDFATYGLVESITGIRSARAHMARAGSARTPAKSPPRAENGKKGGRPRKQNAD